MCIGSKLKQLRKSKRLTQQEVADFCGTTKGAISNYELGRREPDLKVLEKFASFYGVGLDYFGKKEATDEVKELLIRAEAIFKSGNIPVNEKDKLAQRLMRLYVNILENEE
ncbi:MAG: helix-turn-helix transcriptional regulator [Clostridia bacterium]|nr:helix-turn-helix transcriptional regulator [Clostridia bacterium]